MPCSIRPRSRRPSRDRRTHRKPAKDKEANDNFKIDWHEALRGVKMEMLSEALADARVELLPRSRPARTCSSAGSTASAPSPPPPGLEKAFPKLADADKNKAFLAQLDELTARAKGRRRQRTSSPKSAATLRKLRIANNDTVQLPEEVLVSEFADGAFAELDPFSNMIWPNDLEEFNKTTQGEFSGVGIQIQSDEDGSLKVVSPLEDSPAYKAGIKAGDVITAHQRQERQGHQHQPGREEHHRPVAARPSR